MSWISKLRPTRGSEVSKSPECGGASIALAGPEHECGHAIVLLAGGVEFEHIDCTNVAAPGPISAPDYAFVVLVAGVVAHSRALDAQLPEDWWTLLQSQFSNDGDLGQIARLLGKAAPDVTREELLRYVRRAEAILDCHTEQFAQLVGLLRQKGRITYTEAKEIFDGGY